MTRLGQTIESSFYLPNSSLNEGRNELLRQLLVRYPYTVFQYYIYVDEDLVIATDPQISSVCDEAAAADSAAAASNARPFENSVGLAFTCSLRYFERILLEYRPALAVPRNSIQHDMDPTWRAPVVQLLPDFMVDFDHILVAVRAEVASMFLPMETRFDNNCWWHAQAVWSVVAQAFYRQQTMQFNAIYTRSGYSRPSVEGNKEHNKEGKAEQQQQQKRYFRCGSLSPAPLWIINSLHSHLQQSIMFRSLKPPSLCPPLPPSAPPPPCTSISMLRLPDLVRRTNSVQLYAAYATHPPTPLLPPTPPHTMFQLRWW